MLPIPNRRCSVFSYQYYVRVDACTTLLYVCKHLNLPILLKNKLFSELTGHCIRFRFFDVAKTSCSVSSDRFFGDPGFGVSVSEVVSMFRGPAASIT